jgi:hypothetical protein
MCPSAGRPRRCGQQRRGVLYSATWARTRSPPGPEPGAASRPRAGPWRRPTPGRADRASNRGGAATQGNVVGLLHSMRATLIYRHPPFHSRARSSMRRGWRPMPGTVSDRGPRGCVHTSGTRMYVTRHDGGCRVGIMVATYIGRRSTRGLQFPRTKHGICGSWKTSAIRRQAPFRALRYVKYHARTKELPIYTARTSDLAFEVPD